MEIKYVQFFNKDGALSIDLSYEERSYNHEKGHVELLADILNGNFAKSEWSEDKPFSFSCPADCDYEDYIQYLVSLVGSDKIKEDVELHNKLKEQLYTSFDLSKYKDFVSSVFVNKRDGLSSYQLYVAYVLSNQALEFGDFSYEVATDNDIYIPSNIKNDELMEITMKTQGLEAFEKLKSYLKGKPTPTTILPVYRFINFEMFLRFLIYTMAINNERINICKNCGTYFRPPLRSDTLYCSNKSPQDSTKTCREYGAIKTYQDNLKTNKAMSLYRSIYMQKQMLSIRHPDLPNYKDDFENYKAESKQWKSDVKKGIKNEAAYLEWLESICKKKEV